MTPAAWLRVRPAALTGLAYALFGWASMALALTPGYAAPLFPSAGIALACILTYGRSVLPGIALGSFVLNLGIGLNNGTAPGLSAAAALAIAGGATLQAELGRALIRRWVRQPLALSDPGDVARFFLLGALLASLVNASIGTLAIGLTRPGTAAALRDSWWAWWTGDALGVLIGTPVVLTLIGRPAPEWRHRRGTLGLSLVFVTALLASASAQVARWDHQRTWVIFDRDATRASGALEAQLQQPLFALEALHGAAEVLGGLDQAALERVATYWLQHPYHLRGMGWEQRLPRSEVPAFEAAVQRELQRPSFHVFDRTDAQAAPEAARDTEVIALRNIAPLAPNSGALGVNVLSIAAARPAILATLAQGQAAASGGFRLTQDSRGEAGVVIYQAVGRPRPYGLVFATLQIQRSFNAAAAQLPSYLQWCLVDQTPATQDMRILAGGSDCDRAQPHALVHRQPISFAGRQWELQLRAREETVPDAGHWNAWLFSLVGLMATAMLGALLLTVTGRTRRIEAAVDERTAELRREIGERQRTEAALRESEQRFRNIVDQVPIGVVYTDLDNRIEAANPHVRAMLGYRLDELVGRRMSEITPAEDRALTVGPLRQLLAGEIPHFSLRKRFLARDGRALWCQITVSLLRDASGTPQRLVGLVEDVTERLRLEDAERARERAEAASRAKSEFVSRMSHELRTPLNAMLGFAQLLELDRQAPLAPHQRDWTFQIQQAGWHLLHMINDTLDLSRIEAGAMKLDIEAVPVEPLVSASAALVLPAAQQHGVTVEQRVEPGLALQGDATRIKQILTNLLSNAVKYNVDGGRVEVTARRLDERTGLIEVHDTGQGMSREQLGGLFQPFNRLGRDGQIEGTGIGLVISRRLAELMNGQLEADSEPGRGSRFSLRLPLAREALPQAPEPGGAGAGGDGGYHARRVHYVEDNDTNTEVMSGILAQRPQILLTVSRTGAEALAALRHQRPHLVLLDMHLPDIDGLELLRQLKADPDTAPVPVVVVSADATPARIEQALAQGANRYLTKPVNVAEVLALMDELLAMQDTEFGALH